MYANQRVARDARVLSALGALGLGLGAPEDVLLGIWLTVGGPDFLATETGAVFNWM